MPANGGLKPAVAPDDALAIVGLACRLPGDISTLDALWSALLTRQNLITDVPPGRFDTARFEDHDPSRPGKSSTFAGGYIGDVAGFDAAYFGISPREAALMDPQQRLVLEMTAEAFDDAGIDPASVAGTEVAVFVGMSDMGYLALQTRSPETMGSHTMTGGALSIASNRLSYVFDLRGPSMTIDTACSSAMVGLHQAAQAVLSGRSPMAVVAGVHLLLGPHPFIGFSKAGMLSPLGRCAAFSADADGYVRAEGGGVLLVKRLSDALAGGDRVHAVILATHVNTDGRSRGMTVPSVEAHETLLREVYLRAGLCADDLSYLEAHGTGTPVGDPIECQAVGRALGRLRSPGHPLPIGSVKTNLGHMEPAAAMSGILKAILVLRHRTIPPSLHGTPPNPSIDFADLGLAQVHECLPIHDQRAVVGVSSYGFGGANGHVVLAEAPNSPQPSPRRTGDLPVIVSARTETALVEAADQMARHLAASAEDGFYDICYTAARRARHDHRAVVLASTAQAAADRLRAVIHAESLDGARQVATAGGRVVFAFSGNGSQWPEMGADLLVADPVFRAAVELVDRMLRPHVGWSVLAELLAPPEVSRLADTVFAQPALFAVQVGLVQLLADRGVRPAAVVGHSVGEVAAAYAAGALDLESACRVIAGRAQAQGITEGQGRMAAVGLSRSRAEQSMAAVSAGHLDIAAVNTNDDVTVSGDAAAIAELQSQLDDTVFFRELGLDYAFHGPTMDATEQHLRASLGGLRSSPPTVPFVSTVTGGLIGERPLDADYWWANVRQPVLFATATRYLRDEDFDVFVEIGPHPVLSGYIRRITASDGPTAVVATLRRKQDGPGAIRATMAALIAAGAAGDEKRYFPHPGRVVDVPPYPWQREHYWQGTAGQWVRSSGDGTIDHPLLGERMPFLEPTWIGTIEPDQLPWLASHRVGGVVLMPASGFVEMALAAGRRVQHAVVEITDLTIPAPLPLPLDEELDVRTQTSMTNDDGAFRIASMTGTGTDWHLHAKGRVRRLVCDPPASIDLAGLRDQATEHWDADAFYALLEGAGLDYGPYFQVLHDVYAGPDQVLAYYSSAIDQDGYDVHPAILDGALHAGTPLLLGQSFLPGAIDRIRLWRQPSSTGFVHVRHRSRTRREACWDVVLGDEDGAVVAELLGCRMRRAGVDAADPTRYVTVLRAAPQAIGAGPAPSSSGPRAVVAVAKAHIDTSQKQWDHAGYGHAQRIAKEAAAHFARTAVDDMLPGQREFSIDGLIAAGMLPKYARLWRLLVSLGEKHGLFEHISAGRWRTTTQQARSPREFAQKTLRDFPQYSADVLLWARVAGRWADILCGRADAVHLMFGDNGSDTMDHFYQASPLAAVHQRTALSLVAALARRWPADRPLRVLEIGAGTGGATGSLLPILPPERTQYVFTDASAAFFVAAKKRFEPYDFVEYRCLDIDNDLQEQGFDEASFDLIVASYVLHVARDVRCSLGRLGRLLAPGGQLLASEFHDPELLAGSFGFLDQFWTYVDDDLRSESPLLSRDQWPALFRQCGFDEVVQCGIEEEPARSDGSLTLGQWPHHPSAPPALPPAEPGVSWLVAVEDPSDIDAGSELARALCFAGGTAAVETADSCEGSLAGCIQAGGSVVFLLGGGHEDGAGTAVTRAVSRFALLRSFARTCEAFPPRPGTTLWLVTRPSGALPAPERPLMPADAALWGASRALANEHTGAAVKRISWERAGDATAEARRLARELLAPTDEDEVVLTGAGRFVPRQVERRRPQRLFARGERGYELALRHQGPSYELVWVEARAGSPAADEVVIEVRAAALNYVDVMIATGAMPPDAEGPGDGEQVTGLECAGVVTQVGRNVHAFRPGDRVFGLAARSFASHVVTKATALIAMPPGMDFVEAATLPVAFLTVHHSLDHVARLAPGETVLVHGAAGGVGLAAVQYAGLVGARAIGTAGTPAKRNLSSMLGVDHVFDSRNLAFAEQIAALTQGAGVDVVLNSLSGEAIPRSLELLRPYGRFVELGKRDIYANSRLALRAFRNNISLFCVDVSQLATAHPSLARSHVEEIAHRVHAGEYRPLLHRVYPAGRIAEAFQLMQHSRHVGKVVVTFDDPVAVECSPTTVQLDPQATYLITGGLSGLGAATAQALGRLGARHLALVGRRGIASPEAPELIHTLARQGIEASVYPADVGAADAMAAVLAAVDSTGHPLRGVVHSAMQLDDCPVHELDSERFRAVVSPKMQGAMVLDCLTRDRALDFFVAYSSITATLGTLNQANYSAANLFLEALTRARRQSGRPALAVAWAAIGEVGYVARHVLRDSLTGMGVLSLTSDQAMDAFIELLGLPDSVVSVGDLDWGRLSVILPSARTPRLAGLLPPLIQGTDYRHDEFMRILSQSPPDDARGLVEKALIQIVAGIMKCEPDRIDRARRLTDMGMDSLMSVEMVANTSQQLQLEIPLTELANSGQTIAAVANVILTRLNLHPGAPSSVHPPSTAPDPESVPPDPERAPPKSISRAAV